MFPSLSLTLFSLSSSAASTMKITTPLLHPLILTPFLQTPFYRLLSFLSTPFHQPSTAIPPPPTINSYPSSIGHLQPSFASSPLRSSSSAARPAHTPPPPPPFSDHLPPPAVLINDIDKRGLLSINDEDKGKEILDVEEVEP